VNGKTTEGHMVVGNVFMFHSSVTGLPLDVIIQSFNEVGMIVDWQEFVQDAILSGWKKERILEGIDYALVDVFGPSYRDAVLSKLVL
jgi:hypothetical protein